ncbi:hypothetical protein X769_31465 [Mesorhizobium sp. LSJC268A00]|nr:hypothetical protein X771_32460 [Mesorhizobium sp. LSJC277A00]ESW64405.1 hypothetical protein X773_32850 [Mesorhizobium sp. LSJC285A00]ESW80043.1 hypothetical protein X770_31225 [Mesorhizobium sp. LSJC269B00]ESW94818.1 hypothetical protein X769_31465 [Mesorhizobium sp. LSJC268A00]ESX09118.1 hypothetical protein X768_19645 [Mesorhizobium sp. LSJC265A00]ESZ01176.1 hypothetical protein X736_32230 [Mesorhizobium sp. L2C089B000]ESZ21379.1 hypothetical protein X733_33815 [Mesorhizobium sp. L2C06
MIALLILRNDGLIRMQRARSKSPVAYLAVTASDDLFRGEQVEGQALAGQIAELCNRLLHPRPRR